MIWSTTNPQYPELDTLFKDKGMDIIKYALGALAVWLVWKYTKKG